MIRQIDCILNCFCNKNFDLSCKKIGYISTNISGSKKRVEEAISRETIFDKSSWLSLQMLKLFGVYRIHYSTNVDDINLHTYEPRNS